MKILRSLNRRGFSVGTAGWFTVLRPNAWFAASRLPGAFRNFGGRSKPAKEPAAWEQNDHGTVTHQPTVEFQTLKPVTEHRRVLPSALIVLAATAITLFLLWWIFVRPHPVW